MQCSPLLANLLTGHEPESTGKPEVSIRFTRNGRAVEAAKRIECGVHLTGDDMRIDSREPGDKLAS